MRAVSLDSLAAEHPPPSFLEIDAEGAETAILRGASRVLHKLRPVVVCELHGRQEREEVRGLLAGYDLADAGGEWRIVARPAETI